MYYMLNIPYSKFLASEVLRVSDFFFQIVSICIYIIRYLGRENPSLNTEFIFVICIIYYAYSLKVILFK